MGCFICHAKVLDGIRSWVPTLAMHAVTNAATITLKNLVSLARIYPEGYSNIH
jgi:hypothetical protein